MDPDIHFGEFEQSLPTARARPDQDGRLAVVGVGSLGPEDLPVFVDLDAMREVSLHAHSDRQVELGGVLLGGQYLDEQGRSFVLVSDCLRARHYESTKGSFKFTHDTWEQITREREQLPAGLEMVGWYHTHPGWGVFLSGLDLFICDNFFNKPLDVALVVDPCRGDTGFFQWTGESRERIRRTGGYMLFASRFRRDELQQLATELESQVMPESVRTAVSPVNVHIPAPAPIPVGYGLALLGMVAGQFCLILLLAIRLFVPAASPDGATGEASSSARNGSLADEPARLDPLRRRESEIDAKLEVLELVVRQQGNAAEGVLQALAARTSEVEESRGSLRAQQSLARELDTKIASLESSLRNVRESDERRGAEVIRLQGQLQEFESNRSPESKQKSLELKPSGSLAENGSWWSLGINDRTSFGAGSVLGAGLVGLAWFFWKRSQRTESSTPHPADDGD